MTTLFAAVGDPTVADPSVAAPMLDPPTRAVLLMALLAFVILGLGLMLGVVLGGRWVRRLGGKKLTTPLPLVRGGASNAAEGEPAMLRHTHWGGAADAATGETTRLDASAETQPG